MAQLLDLIIAQFEKSIAALESAVGMSDLDPTIRRDASLLRLELAYELSAKVTKRVLVERYGFSAPAPKTAFREAHRVRLLDADDTETFIRFADDRNRMVHDYSEEFSNALYQRTIEEYLPILNRLADAIRKQSA